MAAYTTKLTVRDSFDDEDVSDDVDDEVFIRDGRNGYKIDEEIGVKRPLMAPRRKQKQAKLHPDTSQRSRINCRSCLAPCCYGLLALAVLLGLIALAVIIINFLPLPLDRLQFWKIRSPQTEARIMVPCTDFAITDVWVQTFPKLTSETPVHLADFNQDGVLDIVFGYGTGADGRNVPDYVCELYFGRDPPCLGGILALDGKTGRTIWQHWTQRPVFTLDCGADLTQDNISDCLVGGKGGLLHVVNGHDGSLVWHFEDDQQQQVLEPLLDVYSAQFLSDVDGDGFVDVIATHTATETIGTIIKGQLMLVSGKTGRLLRALDTPGSAESYYAPQLLVRPDGQEEILFGTGGTAGQSWGGIHVVPLSQLASSEKLTARALLMSDTRGVMSPPVLADITRDGTEDIIISLFNSTVVAIDGITFLPLWNFSFPNSQTFSPPTPGYFNDDDVPDFLVKYQTGPDFPVYYYSQMNILDGKTGTPLLDHPVVDSVGSQMGGLSLSVEGSGSDWVFFWTADCAGHEGSQTPFSFVKGTTLIAQSRADLCRLRFNSTMSTTFWAINQHVEPPGVAIYSSEWRQILEYNTSQYTEGEAYRYISSHPDFWNTYGAEVNSNPLNPGAHIPESNQKPVASNFRHKTPSLAVGNNNNSPYENQNYQRTLSHIDALPGGSNILASSSSDSGMREMEEMEEPDYTRMQAHSISKHRRPPLQWPQQERTWGGQISDQNSYAVPGTEDRRTYDSSSWDSEPRSRDYDLPVGDTDASLVDGAGSRGADFSPSMLDVGLLSGQRNERSEEKEVPRFLVKPEKDGVRTERETVPVSAQSKHDDEHWIKIKNAQKRAVDVDENADGNAEHTTDTGSQNSRGIYLLTSTGTLAPPISGHGMDLVLVSYWIPPTDGVQILLPAEIECVQNQLLQASADLSGKYAGMSQEALEMLITQQCLGERKTGNSTPAPVSSQDSQSSVELHPGLVAKASAQSVERNNAYNALGLKMGQLTVYRLNLQCQCRKVRPQHETCANILPYEKQSWPSFMGHGGKGHFKPHN